MKKKLLFFVNPRAGQMELRLHLMDIIDVFTAGGYDVTVHPTQSPRDLTELIAREGGSYDLVVCAGGDGTLNEAVSGLMQLEKGDMVRHTAFGQGMVLSVRPMGGDALVEVAFDQVGSKKLMLKSAGKHMEKL